MIKIWETDEWKKYYDLEKIRSGVRLCFDVGIDPEVRRACKEFCVWMRKKYFFPVRVPIYVKNRKKIKALDGDWVFGTFFMPDDRNLEPYIRIAAGDYSELVLKLGKDNALATILGTISHELTHYFQWINHAELTQIGIERQASRISSLIIDEYAETREHP